MLYCWLSRYHPQEIVVTENGMDVKGEDAMPLAQALNDTVRINNFEEYISAASDAVITDKVRIELHMGWYCPGSKIYVDNSEHLLC